MRRKPRKCNYVKAIPKLYFASPKGAIEIRHNSITITGTVEGAALALAEDILKKPIVPQRTYLSTIEVLAGNGQYTLNLLKPTVLEPEIWIDLKKDVEKMCNNLKAFL